MNVSIVNRDTGHMTTYGMTDLAKMARAHVKGRGKLQSYWLTFHESSGRASLVCQYQIKGSAWATSESIAI